MKNEFLCGEAGDGTTAGAFAARGFALLPAAGVFAATFVLFDFEAGLFGFALLATFFDDLFGAFFGAAGFFAAFLTFFAPRLPVFARFFGADALVALRRDLRAFFAAFFALRFLTVFLLAVATTISFYRSGLPRDDCQRSA